MGTSSGGEGCSGDATAHRIVHRAWRRMWVSGAFPLLMQAKIQNHVSRGSYQFYAPAVAGEELARTWSIAFVNGCINRLELVSDSEPTTPDYVEMEILPDLWRFDYDKIEDFDIDREIDLVAEEEAISICLPVRYPFKTYIKKSEVDENKVLTLEYPLFSIMYGLIDDLRKIDDGVLLGQMHYRFIWQKKRTFIGCFSLCALVPDE